MLNVKKIRDLLKHKFRSGSVVVDKTGGSVVELYNIQLLADENYIVRPPNVDYCNVELDWYLSNSLQVYDIAPPVPKIWRDVADENGKINSNYGWCIFSSDNYNQYDCALTELITNPLSRRATMIYTRPSMHIDAFENGMNDFMCTNTVQLLLRDNNLHYMINQRSLDAVFGYNNDFFWHDYVANKLFEELKVYHRVDDYKITWWAGSLHVYERHHKYLAD